MKFVGAVLDLDLVAVMHRVPGIHGLLSRADEYSGVRLRALRLVHNANDRIADRLAVVDQQTHAADGLQRAVLDDKFPGADVPPAAEILTVEEWFPGGLACATQPDVPRVVRPAFVSVPLYAVLRATVHPRQVTLDKLRAVIRYAAQNLWPIAHYL